MLACVAGPVVLLNGDINDAVLGFVLSSFISFVLALYLKYYPVKKFESKLSNLSYRDIFEYAVPLLMAGFWGVLIRASDHFFVSRYFGTEVFAEFANGSLELPFVSMVVSAASVVLSPIYSRKAFDNSEESRAEMIRLWHSVFKKTIMMTYPMVAFFYCFSDVIMILMYGDKYASSGEFFQAKLLVNFFTLIAYGPLILAIGGNRYYNLAHMINALTLIILQAMSVYIIDSAIAIVYVSVFCQIALILSMIVFVCNYFKIGLLEIFPWKMIANILLPSFIILYSLRYFYLSFLEISSLIYVLISSGFMYLFIFGAWSYFAGIDYNSMIFRSLKGRS